MIYLLYALFILSCIALIISVLLQPGKSDAGALFTSSVSSTAFGPRGTLNILSKITIGAAAVFMLSAFLLSQPAITGNRSVLETTAAPVEEATPAAAPEASPAISPAASPDAAGANANSSAANVNAATSNASATNAANAAAAPAANSGGQQNGGANR